MEWMRIGELAALGTALLWTLSTLAWTAAGRHIGSLAVCFLRLIITCGLLAMYGRFVRGLWLPTDASSETWLLLGLSGFVGFFLADLCLFQALLLIGPRLTLLLQALAPPITALTSWVFLHDTLGPKGWLGMAVTLGGVTWVVLERPGNATERQPQLRWGVLLGVLGAVGMAVGLVLSKRGLGDYDAVAATFIRVLGAMIGYLGLITVAGRWTAMTVAARHGRAMIVVTFGSIVGPFVGVALSLVAVRHCNAGVVATILSTMPVLVLPMVIVLYGEKVSFRAVYGAVLAVVGVAILAI